MSTTYSRTSSNNGRNERALVSFRIVLPAGTTPQTVHLLGSWDNFRTAFVMEQDIRVGRGVWKYMITDKGGLEMGSEYTYYFLLDSKCCMSDPGSSPDLVTVDPRTGRLVSILYVPIELPPSVAKPPPPPPPPHVYLPAKAPASPVSPLDDREKTISPVSVIGASVFGGSGDDGGREFEEPRRVPEHPTHSRNNSGSLRERIKEKSARRVSSMFFGGESNGSTTPAEETTTKRKWSLVKKTSGFFRGRNKIGSDDGDKAPKVVNTKGNRAGEVIPSGFGEETPLNTKAPASLEPNHNVSDIVGYLREESSTGLVNDISRRTQPARAYYHSPISVNTQALPIPDPRPQMPRSTSDASNKTTETTDTSPSLIHSLTSNCSCNEDSCTCSPMVQSAFSPEESCSSDDEEEEGEDAYEVDTPVDGLGITTPYQHSERVYPKYYNFDEVSNVPGGNRDIGKYAGDVILNESAYSGMPGGPKPLSCLREEVAGELAWRNELVDELGYLSGVVI